MLKLQPTRNKKVLEEKNSNILSITELDALLKDRNIIKNCNTYDNFQALQGLAFIVINFFNISYTISFFNSFSTKLLIAFLTFLFLGTFTYIIINKISHIFLKKLNFFKINKSYKEIDNFLYEENNLNIVIDSFTMFFKENPNDKRQKKFKTFLLNVATKEKVEVIPTFSDFILAFYKHK